MTTSIYRIFSSGHEKNEVQVMEEKLSDNFPGHTGVIVRVEPNNPTCAAHFHPVFNALFHVSSPRHRRR